MVTLMADSKKTNELVELETVEVSLVDKGANRRTFAIRKAEKQTMQVIDAILSAPFEHKEAVAEHLKKAEMSPQATEAVEAAMQLLSAVQEEMPEDMMKQLMAMAGMSKQEEEEEEAPEATEEAAEALAEEGAEAAEEETEKEDDEEEMQKRLASLPEEMRGMVEQLWKSNRSEIAKREELEAQIKKADEEKRLGDFIAKARQDFPSLPAKAEELGAFISGLDGEAAAFAQSLLKSANEMIATGGITSEIGKSSTDAQELDSISKAERMAAEIVEKEGITKAAAKGRVWKNNPELYAAYLQEKGQ
jgi:colicin import membrane protein